MNKAAEEVYVVGWKRIGISVVAVVWPSGRVLAYHEEIPGSIPGGGHQKLTRSVRQYNALWRFDSSV